MICGDEGFSLGLDGLDVVVLLDILDVFRDGKRWARV